MTNFFVCKNSQICFKTEEAIKIRSAVFSSVLKTIKIVTEECRKRGIAFEFFENKQRAERLRQFYDDTIPQMLEEMYTDSVADDVEKVIQDATFRKVFTQRRYV